MSTLAESGGGLDTGGLLDMGLGTNDVVTGSASAGEHIELRLSPTHRSSRRLCLLLPSRDPYFVQCEPISGRL